MVTDFEEVLQAANRLAANKQALKSEDSPYWLLCEKDCPEQWQAAIERDEQILRDWAIERLLGEEELDPDTDPKVQCFVCYAPLGSTKELYPAVVAEVTGNYGSTVYDPAPGAEDNSNTLYLYICDMCLCERKHLITSRKENFHNLGTYVGLPFETVQAMVPELRARYEKHLEWRSRAT